MKLLLTFYENEFVDISSIS